MWGKIDRIALAVFLCFAAAWIIKNGASTEPPSLAGVDAEALREPAKQLAMTDKRSTARKGDLLGKSPVQTGYPSQDAPVDPYAGFEARIVPKNVTMLAKTAPQATGDAETQVAEASPTMLEAAALRAHLSWACFACLFCVHRVVLLVSTHRLA
jgi:hypothetical protein